MSTKNNFDLIRILAAFQVLITHSVERLEIKNEWILFICNHILIYFPGVPIFFVISGFLIYSSFERNKNNILQYAVNRCLRIFPALWICIVFTFMFMNYDYGGSLLEEAPRETLQWFAAQFSFLQFYTPDVLKFWGNGIPNGSLWTISVELQFYIILPLLFWMFNNSRWGTMFMILTLLVCLSVNSFIGIFDGKLDWYILQLGKVCVVTHLHYFLMGILLRKYWEKVSFLFRDKAFVWLACYAVFTILTAYGLHLDTISYYISTPANLIADLLIGGVTLSLAYSFTSLSGRLIKGQDISYGVYIYHLVVVNILIQRGYVGEVVHLGVVICLTVLLAFLSWILLERKVLASKYVIAQSIGGYWNRKWGSQKRQEMKNSVHNIKI